MWCGRGRGGGGRGVRAGRGGRRVGGVAAVLVEHFLDVAVCFSGDDEIDVFAVERLFAVMRTFLDLKFFSFFSVLRQCVCTCMRISKDLPLRT